jgi:hypothetical protein
MVQLSDGSLLVATSTPATGNYFNSTGAVVRLVDANHDGVADGPGTVLYSGLPGSLTAVRQGGQVIFVTSSQAGSERITVLRAGPTPADPLTLVGSINFAFPAGWEHTTYETLVRPTPGQPGNFDLFLNVGSPANDSSTTTTIPMSGLITGALNDDSIYRVTVHDTGGTPAVSNLTQIATGLRNAAGMVLDPYTNLYFEDNGIDGGGNPEEELSADEINRISWRDVGKTVPDFGFPSTYIDYQTGKQVGSQGVPPFVAFLPDPTTGAEIAGATQLTYAPAAFPADLRNGFFMGFHGLFGIGGTANDENPFVYVDKFTGKYIRFIPGSQAGFGHLDGVLATSDSLFIADLSSTGDVFNSTHTGVIYQIQFVPSTVTISGASTATAGVPYTLNLAAKDPGGDAITSWTIHWGDGSVQTFTGNPSQEMHTYAARSWPYTITASATDEDGTFNSNTLSVTVRPAAPGVLRGGIVVNNPGRPSPLILATLSAQGNPVDASQIRGLVVYGVPSRSADATGSRVFEAAPTTVLAGADQDLGGEPSTRLLYSAAEDHALARSVAAVHNGVGEEPIHPAVAALDEYFSQL